MNSFSDFLKMGPNNVGNPKLVIPTYEHLHGILQNYMTELFPDEKIGTNAYCVYVMANETHPHIMLNFHEVEIPTSISKYFHLPCIGISSAHSKSQHDDNAIKRFIDFPQLVESVTGLCVGFIHNHMYANYSQELSRLGYSLLRTEDRTGLSWIPPRVAEYMSWFNHERIKDAWNGSRYDHQRRNKIPQHNRNINNWREI